MGHFVYEENDMLAIPADGYSKAENVLMEIK